MLKIREGVFNKLTGYDPIKVNHQMYVIKHIHQIDDGHAQLQLVTTNHDGSIMLGGHHEAIVDVEILNTEAFTDFLLNNDFSGLLTALEPADYPAFLQNIVDFGRIFDHEQYRVIQIAATHVINILTRLVI